MLCCPCFWSLKSKVHPSVPVTPAESGSKRPTETPGTSEKSTGKKKDGARRTSKWCFWRKNNKVQPASFTEGSETPQETPQNVFLKLLAGATPGQLSKTNKKTSTSRNEKSAERKQVSVKPASKLPGKKCIQGKEAGVKINLPSSMRITAMKEERKKTTQYEQEKKPTERKETTSNRLNMKKAETKQVSVRPTSKLPGTKRLEVKEAHVRTTAMRKEKEEKRTTTLYGQEKKTAERKETTSNRLNMKTAETKPVIVSPISKHPWTKRIEVKEAHVRTNLQSSAGTTAMKKEKEERKEMTLRGQDRKEERKEMTLYKSEDEMAKFMEVLMELAFSSYMEYKKRMTDPHAFSSKKMIPEGNIKSPIPTPSEGNIKSPIPTPSEGNIKSPIPAPSEGNIKSPIPAPSEGNIKSPIPTPSEGNIKSPIPTPSEGNINSTTLTLPPITDKQELTGGLPNFGNNCYVNASLQCLFTAESFCGELSYLLDNSVHKLEYTFLRCFVELSRLRKSSEVQGDISKDSLLLALIESATDINPEFTINEQNDAHEFLCHCLTQMEESGRWLGWQEDVEPRCPVRANFKFKMRNIITCSSCGSQQNNKVEVFNHISLPLVHNSVDQCLYDVVNNPKVLESKCKVCGGEVASSRWTFHTLPRFLILQLNRFKVTEYYTVVKLDMPVEIKPELQINCLPQSDTPGIENSKAEARETDRNELGGSAATYRLISVLSHVGSTTLCGHYLSDCSSSSQQWMTYNDQLVTLTTETDVLKMRSTSAYVLLYERVSTG
ncbi:hypothetical protein PGIGA_G00199620 [Pangasianodon gigas]|uniref:Uncharacterized protein n=1 Tax=Pangasianodon gigas TaxID=30993 RepID=A0ACC5WEN9_PANGG|nr:hypothetical protein [Pangasianodon gigas]